MKHYEFDAAAARDGLVAAIRALAKQQNFSRVVIGISGGKDSTVCAALCVRALGAENVYGVMLPDGEQKDIADSVRVCEALGFDIADTVGFGDSMNDLEMIETVGTSVCMANGSPNLQKKSDIVCPAVDEDGLAKAFKDLGLC